MTIGEVTVRGTVPTVVAFAAPGGKTSLTLCFSGTTRLTFFGTGVGTVGFTMTVFTGSGVFLVGASGE